MVVPLQVGPDLRLRLPWSAFLPDCRDGCDRLGKVREELLSNLECLLHFGISVTVREFEARPAFPRRGTEQMSVHRSSSEIISSYIHFTIILENDSRPPPCVSFIKGCTRMTHGMEQFCSRIDMHTATSMNSASACIPIVEPRIKVRLSEVRI